MTSRSAHDVNSQAIPRDVLVIGGSAGGWEPTCRLLAALPCDGTLVVGVVLHRSPEGGPSSLASWIARQVGCPVIEPARREPVTAGVVFLAPRDMHLVFKRGNIVPVHGPKEHFTRPSVNPLFMSAAQWYGRRVMGVLLSGGGSDGVEGLIRIKERGGLSFVQHPADAIQPLMPSTAIREDHVDAALSIADLGYVIPRLARGQRITIAASPHS